MDIGLNKALQFNELHAFLIARFPEKPVFLLYNGVNEWEDMPPKAWAFQFTIVDDIEQGFKYGLSLFVPVPTLLPLIESVAYALSNHFDCATFCDASRVLKKERNVIYVLLFENGRVFLADDHNVEISGQLTKINEIDYVAPTH